MQYSVKTIKVKKEKKNDGGKTIIDEKGNVVDGDLILYIVGKYMKERGTLGDTKIVTTIMSNFGLYKALDELGIGYEKTAVGDKYVYENMRENGLLHGPLKTLLKRWSSRLKKKSMYFRPITL